MSSPSPLPHLPLVRLRASRSDVVRSLLERQPAWSHSAPVRQLITGDRGVSWYRVAPESFSVQVRWRWRSEQWEEGEVDVLPGATVALRLVLGDVSPQAVTKKLDLLPTRAFMKGEGGVLARSVRDEGLWIYEVLPGAFCFPEEKVAELLALLRGRAGFREVLSWPTVQWAGVTVKLRGPIERLGGFSLEPRVLEDLVGLSLALDLELTAE